MRESSKKFALPPKRMSSSSGSSRPIYFPDSDFSRRKIPVTRQPAQEWFRVHRSDLPAIQFGIHAHHRFSHPKSLFPVLYLGGSVPTCLWEYFGDEMFGRNRVISAGRWDGCSLSRVDVPQLGVCALGRAKTRDAMGVDKGSLLASDLNVPQSWALAIQEHPLAFGAIKYNSRFIDKPCLALFDRSGLRAMLRETLLGTLNSLDAAVNWLDARKVSLV